MELNTLSVRIEFEKSELEDEALVIVLFRCCGELQVGKYSHVAETGSGSCCVCQQLLASLLVMSFLPVLGST